MALIACGLALGGLAGHRSPRLFFRPLEGDFLDSYGEAAAVSHNAGDSLAATRQALDHAARIVEVDVVWMGGRLHASHDAPLGLGGDAIVTDNLAIMELLGRRERRSDGPLTPRPLPPVLAGGRGSRPPVLSPGRGFLA